MCCVQVEELQQTVTSLETEAELLRSQLHAVTQDKDTSARTASVLQGALQDAHQQVSHHSV